LDQYAAKDRSASPTPQSTSTSVQWFDRFLTKEKETEISLRAADEVDVNDDNIYLGKKLKTENDVPPDAGPAVIEPPTLYTLRPKRKAKNDQAYLAGVPYKAFPKATKPSEASFEPAPMFALNGDALHLYFEVASEEAVEASYSATKREEYEALIVAAMRKTSKTQAQLKNTGSLYPGITLTVGTRKYSLACFLGRKRNEVTTATTKNGLDSRCRACATHLNTLNLRLKCTSDPESSLNKKESDLNQNDEWSQQVLISPQKQSISFSAVLRVLDNGYFLHMKIKMI
jgi:hypothetical protein